MKYSIITINYNNCEGLRQTIESVVNQTFKDFEYVIIDGGSTDGSVDIIKLYADKIAYWVSEPDKGIYNAMNKGILKAHGEYLNFMNSGDCFYDNDVLKKILQNLDCDFVTGKTYYEGGVHGFYKNDVTMLDFFKGSLDHQATFIKKELFTNKLYDESFKIISDWIFFVEKLIFENATFHNTDIIVCKFESGGISMSSPRLVEEEGQKVFNRLFPKRIQNDYFRWKKIDSPLSDLVAEFNDSVGFLKLVEKMLKTILKIRRFIKH